MGRFDDDVFVEVDELGTIVRDPVGVKWTKEQRDIVQARLRAAEIYLKTGDRTLAEMAGLFPKRQNKCSK